MFCEYYFNCEVCEDLRRCKSEFLTMKEWLTKKNLWYHFTSTWNYISPLYSNFWAVTVFRERCFISNEDGNCSVAIVRRVAQSVYGLFDWFYKSGFNCFSQFLLILLVASGSRLQAKIGTSPWAQGIYIGLYSTRLRQLIVNGLIQAVSCNKCNKHAG